MSTCPNGHQSAAEDWCEVCGHRMASAPGVPAGAVPPPPMPGPGGYGYPGPGGNSAARGEPCPRCRTPRAGHSPVCEECRYGFLTHSPAAYGPPPPAPPQQMPGGSPGGLDLPPGFQTQGPPGPPSPPAPPPQHHAQSPHGQPDYGQQPGYGYPQPPQPPRQPQGGGGDDWTLPPPSHGGQQPGPHAQLPHGQPDYGRSDYGQQPGYGYPQQPPAPQPPHQEPQHQQGAPPQQQPANWAVTVGPDHEYFTAMMRRSGPEAAGLNMPSYSAEQHVRLSGPQVTIGRRRHSTGESPDIDLGRSPEDPGVSHQHAVLVRQPDGGWSVVDQDSTNGTTINGAEDPIQPFVPVPLREGDRVHVGAWTTITLRRG
ncbi:FHA domain-containing protein [Streptomyces sp. CNQ085]|uniref:FHA domain-containing protein n=1 Tax=Streptomyces sp. CNQ085 TaxID=2886944 RepID=UPI001F50D3DF|nr:FHA domain-containing protein [Streptomyces sp. CNQ085]MCI0383218.1 FHA domain-containing protein [Streptomyces sp. CNQ085]